MGFKRLCKECTRFNNPCMKYNMDMTDADKCIDFKRPWYSPTGWAEFLIEAFRIYQTIPKPKEQPKVEVDPEVKPEDPEKKEEPPSETFLWKPVAEGGKPLVILFPASMKGMKEALVIGSVNEVGRYTGEHNGQRPHYRFTRQGAGYGMNIKVQATLKDNSIRTWVIPDGSKREEY